jgi:hypothetical protein
MNCNCSIKILKKLKLLKVKELAKIRSSEDNELFVKKSEKFSN